MPDLDLLLLGTGAITSARFAWQYRVRPAPELDGWESAPVVDTSLTATWAERVGGQGCALPGSSLDAVVPIRNGREARIELIPGRQTTGDAMTALPKICSALQRPAGSVVVEPTQDGRADHARLLVIDHNPLHAPRPWPGPTLTVDSGVAAAGLHADEETGNVRWLTPGSGAANILIAGSPGAGKSRGLDWLLAESWHATYPHPETGASIPWVHSWVADGQQGQSIPDWLEIAPWAATDTSETLLMLRAAKRVMDRRSRDFSRFQWVDHKGRARRGLKHFDPVLTGRPLLQVVIDEVHAPLGESAEIVALSKEIARKGRKCGVRLVYATQIPSVQNLGNDIDLRSLLSANVLCYRTQDRLSGAMALPGAIVDPGSLPREFPDGSTTAGLAYVVGPGSRPAPLRTWWIEDPYDLCADLPVAPLHARDVEAAGEDFATWRDRRDAALERDDEETEPAPVPLPFPLPEPSEPEPVGVPAVRDMVLTAMHEGARRTADVNTRVQEMAAEHGVTRSYKAIGDALRELSKEAEIIRLGQGKYALPGDDEVAA